MPFHAHVCHPHTCAHALTNPGVALLGTCSGGRITQRGFEEYLVMMVDVSIQQSKKGQPPQWTSASVSCGQRCRWQMAQASTMARVMYAVATQAPATMITINAVSSATCCHEASRQRPCGGAMPVSWRHGEGLCHQLGVPAPGCSIPHPKHSMGA